MTTISEPGERDNLLDESARNGVQGNNQEGSKTDGENEERQYLFYPSKPLMFAFMGVVILMLSLCIDLSNEPPCALKTALDSILLNYKINPCKYNTIKDIANSMYTWGLGLSLWNGCLVLLPPILLHFNIYINWESPYPRILYFTFFVSSSIFMFGIFGKCSELIYAKSTQGNVDYTQLQSLMLSDLEDHYASDNVSIEDKYSRAWNEFFIKYDCCAVREVQGSTNDFVNTPWCKTNGSCKANASKIPKTCCKDVTQDDYQSAPPTCYASANPGTFKRSCISRMRALSISTLDDGTRHSLATYALGIVIYQLFIQCWTMNHLWKRTKAWESFKQCLKYFKNR